MSVSFVCEGCGQRIEVADDYPRNKIQCPSCGVICPIPASARSASPSRKGEGSAIAEPRPAPSEEPALDDADLWGPPERADRPIEEAAPVAKPVEQPPARPVKNPRVQEKPFKCRRCGAKVHRQGECPYCDGAPASAAEEPVSDNPLWRGPQLELPPADETEDEDDEKPYGFGDADVPLCPRCQKPLPDSSVVCVGCGYHRRKRKKIVQKYEPLVRRWETDFTYRQRMRVFVVLQAMVVTSGLLMVLGGDSTLLTFLTSWFLFTAMAAFLLGTYERLDLERGARGHVSLVKTWRVLFIEMKPVPIELYGYEGLVSGRFDESGFWEWFVFFCLLPGVITAGLWWYFTMHKARFFTALAQDHGYPALYLYRGWSQEQMRDIACTVRDAAKLRYDAS
jgi:hypothetical protein